MASIEPEKEAQKDAAVESGGSEEKKKKSLLAPEMEEKLAKYLYLNLDKLSPEYKKAYQKLLAEILGMINTSLLKEDYKKLKGKYLARSGDKLYLEKKAFFEIESDTEFMIFLIRSLVENADLIDSFFVRDGPKKLKMDFHHSGDNELGPIVGFASERFKNSGLEEILRTKNFERMMEINIAWEEASKEGRETSERSRSAKETKESVEEKQPSQTNSGLAKK